MGKKRRWTVAAQQAHRAVVEWFDGMFTGFVRQYAEAKLRGRPRQPVTADEVLEAEAILKPIIERVMSQPPLPVGRPVKESGTVLWADLRASSMIADRLAKQDRTLRKLGQFTQDL